MLGGKRAEEELGSEYAGNGVRGQTLWTGKQESWVQASARGDGESIPSQGVPLGLTCESPFGNQKVDWEGLGVLELEKLGENPYGEEGQ